MSANAEIFKLDGFLEEEKTWSQIRFCKKSVADDETQIVIGSAVLETQKGKDLNLTLKIGPSGKFPTLNAFANEIAELYLKYFDDEHTLSWQERVILELGWVMKQDMVPEYVEGYNIEPIFVIVIRDYFEPEESFRLVKEYGFNNFLTVVSHGILENTEEILEQLHQNPSLSAQRVGEVLRLGVTPEALPELLQTPDFLDLPSDMLKELFELD